MPLTEVLIEKKIKMLKKLKRDQQMMEDFKNVLKKYLDALKALKEFEKKWGASEELIKILVPLEEELSFYSFKPSLIDKITGYFYLRLSLEIEWLAFKLKESVLSPSEILTKFKEKLGIAIRLNDLNRALKILESKNLVKMIKIGNELYVIFPHLLDTELKHVIKLFGKFKYLTPIHLVNELGWKLPKALAALERLYELGLCTREEWPLRYYPIKIK